MIKCLFGGKMKKYIPNLLLAAASSIFIYNGVKAFQEAADAKEELTVVEQKYEDPKYWKQSLESEVRMSRTKGVACFGVAGLLIGYSALEALARRKEEKE